MGRVIHVRIYGLTPSNQEAVQLHFDALVRAREWRDERPWLANSRSRGLFAQLYFGLSDAAAAVEWPAGRPPSAATFVRLRGDETDALALLFILRDLGERFGGLIALRDPDNPIAKLRSIDLRRGRLSAGGALEEVLVRRPVFKKLLDGSRIEMFPPRALGSAFGTVDGEDGERRDWSFLVHGMRDSRPSFLEAEAEAMRIYRGLRFLG